MITTTVKVSITIQIEAQATQDLTSLKELASILSTAKNGKDLMNLSDAAVVAGQALGTALTKSI